MPVIISGRVAVEAALRSPYRSVFALMVDPAKRTRHTVPVEKLARERGTPIEEVSGERLTDETGHASHGGLAVRAGEREFGEVQGLLPGYRPAFLALLDGIEDPYNFGDALRSLYAAGVDGVIVPPRNWTHAADTVARSSAGASELVPMAVIESPKPLGELGLTILYADENAKLSITEADLTVPLLVIVGGEKRGVRKELRNMAGQAVRIPYGRAFPQALSASASAAVIGFEIARQRGCPVRTG